MKVTKISLGDTFKHSPACKPGHNLYRLSVSYALGELGRCECGRLLPKAKREIETIYVDISESYDTEAVAACLETLAKGLRGLVEARRNHRHD